MAARKSIQLMVLVAVMANMWPSLVALGDLAAWTQYKRDFKKIYASPEEEASRRELFTAELAHVETHNSDLKAAYKLAIDEFSDRSYEEIPQSTGIDEQALSAFKIANPWRLDPFLAKILNSNGPVPDEVDWRRVDDRVSGVKDQGRCGSCWAFATTGLLEGQQVVRNYSQQLVPLSEKQLVDCRLRQGCGGDFVEKALERISSYNGIMSELDYHYYPIQTKCTKNEKKFIMSTKGYARLEPLDEEGMKKVVALYGPIVANVGADSWKMGGYKSGILYASRCKGRVDHSVLVVGYGSERGESYWIVKNSWGSRFGEDGYIRIERGANACFIASNPVIAKF